MYKKKLFDILEIIKRDHMDFFFDKSEEEYNKIVEEVLSEYKLENDYDVIYVANIIIKKIIGKYDAHTKVYYEPEFYTMYTYKLRLINGKLYIIDTPKEELKFSEIIKINGVDIKVLIEELRKAHCYQTEEHFETSVEVEFTYSYVLKTLPSINPNDKIILTLRKNGRITEYEPEEVPFEESKTIKPNYTYELIGNILKINYTNCFETHEGQMLEFVEKIKQVVIDKNITKFIVDIRGNRGGDSTIIRPLIKYLEDKKVVALIDKRVFSSARFATIDLKNIGAMMIGTGISTTLNVFGNNLNNHEIKNIHIMVSTNYFYYENEKMESITNTKELRETKEKRNDLFEPIVFNPNIYVSESIEDYIKHVDPYINKAIEDYIKHVDPYINKAIEYFDNLYTQN